MEQEPKVLNVKVTEAKPEQKLTIQESIYHQSSTESPTSYSHTFFRVLEDEAEQPYGPRKAEATEEWTKLDFGWLGENVGLILIQNREGNFPGTLPTIAMRESAKKQMLELGMRIDEDIHDSGLKVVALGIVIMANETMRLTSLDPTSLFLRSVSGKVKYSLTAFPK